MASRQQTKNSKEMLVEGGSLWQSQNTLYSIVTQSIPQAFAIRQVAIRRRTEGRGSILLRRPLPRSCLPDSHKRSIADRARIAELGAARRRHQHPLPTAPSTKRGHDAQRGARALRHLETPAARGRVYEVQMRANALGKAS